VIQYAAFAHPAEAAGVEPDGTVHYSADAGATWTRKGKIDASLRHSSGQGRRRKPLAVGCDR
jgi:hypothetical protein